MQSNLYSQLKQLPQQAATAILSQLRELLYFYHKNVVTFQRMEQEQQK